MTKTRILLVVAMLAAQLLTAASVAWGSSGAATAPGTRFRDCPLCPEMVVIPAGAFTMGSAESEAGRFKNEGPQHQVTIAHAFAMSLYDVTVGEYRRFVHATGRTLSDGCRIYDEKTFLESDLVRIRGRNWQRPNFPQGDRHPVVCVTWEDANAYVAWLNSQVSTRSAGMQGSYRLPTEAEWEYAARAGTTTPFYWGAEIRRDQVNYGPDELRFAPVAVGADRWKYTSPVGSFPPNAFGLYDMSGNVWQFTRDCWHDNYDGAPSDGSARTDGNCDERAVRGGSWFKPPAGERSAKRGEGKIVDLKGNHEIGFRVVRDLDGR